MQIDRARALDLGSVFSPVAAASSLRVVHRKKKETDVRAPELPDGNHSEVEKKIKKKERKLTRKFHRKTANV